MGSGVPHSRNQFKQTRQEIVRSFQEVRTSQEIKAFRVFAGLPKTFRVRLFLNDPFVPSFKNIWMTFEPERFENQKTPFFLFVDEVQYDPNWGITLKSLFDRTKKVFICCSGSSAVSLQTNADVQRRALFEKLYPMSFTEYEMIKNDVIPSSELKDSLKKALYFSENAQESYDQLKKLEVPVSQY